MKENNRNIQHSYKNIYELLWNSEEEITDEFKEKVDLMISKLPDDIMEYLKLAYGTDLENPVRSSSWSKEDTIYFYSYIVPRLKYRINNPNWKRFNPLPVKNNNSKKNEWKYIFKIKSDNIESIKNLFSDRQYIIIRMLLGFDGKRYKAKEIANYFNITLFDIMIELTNISDICRNYFQEDIHNSKRK